MRGTFQSASVQVAVDSRVPWVSRLIQEACPGAFTHDFTVTHTLQVQVEAERAAFDLGGFELVTRGAWSRAGTVVIENFCSSGFDVMLRCTEERATFTYRWRPPPRVRLASAAAPSTFVLLARAALLQYPVLWWAGVHGRAPLHAAVCTVGSAIPLLAGPGGLGKSALLARELAAGARATCDNVCVANGLTAWGLVEPVWIATGQGRRIAHGHSEMPIKGWVPRLTPDCIVVLRRISDEPFGTRRCDPATAARTLVTGTYMAGELRRYWGAAATLTAATGLGPAHPQVDEVARRFASELPCLEVGVPQKAGPRLADLLGFT